MPENFLKCKRILLVEDNELNVEIARTILQDVQAEVEVAADGAIAAGMDDYLAKPIEIDKLLRKIVKVLEKK